MKDRHDLVFDMRAYGRMLDGLDWIKGATGYYLRDGEEARVEIERAIKSLDGSLRDEIQKLAKKYRKEVSRCKEKYELTGTGLR